MHATRLIYMLAVAQSAATAALPDPPAALCTQVRSALSHAESGFKALRGAPDPVISNSDTRYWFANITWEDATLCQVAEASDVTDFICTWRVDSGKAAASRFEQLRTELLSCLGPMEAEILETKSGVVFLRFTYSENIGIRLSEHSGGSGPRTTLTLAS